MAVVQKENPQLDDAVVYCGAVLPAHFFPGSLCRICAGPDSEFHQEHSLSHKTQQIIVMRFMRWTEVMSTASQPGNIFRSSTILT